MTYEVLPPLPGRNNPPVLTARADACPFGYLEVIAGQPVGLHDHGASS